MTVRTCVLRKTLPDVMPSSPTTHPALPLACPLHMPEHRPPGWGGTLEVSPSPLILLEKLRPREGPKHQSDRGSGCHCRAQTP